MASTGSIKVEQKQSKTKRSLFEAKKELEDRKAAEALQAEMALNQTEDSDAEWIEELCRMTDDEEDNVMDAVTTPPKKARIAASAKPVVKTVSPVKERRSPRKLPKKRYDC